MANPTVRTNLETIEALQEKTGNMEAEIEQLRKNQDNIVEALAKALELMIKSGRFQDMLTHRGKWKQVVIQLKEVLDVKNTEERRDSDDQDNH